MDEYLIGAGALLTAGPNATIAGATLHAQADPGLARQIAAAVVDFESPSVAEVSRLLILAAGWSSQRFQDEVVGPLIAAGECALADVFAVLAAVVGTPEIHLFARWQPDTETAAALEAAAIRVICHPLEAIGQASLVSASGSQSGGRSGPPSNQVQPTPRVGAHDAA